MTRAEWLALARLHLSRWEALPAAQKRWMPYPAPVRVPPHVLLALLGETEIDLSPQEGT